MLLLLLPAISFAQNNTVQPGTIDYLDFKKGFKRIVLGAELSDIANDVKEISKENANVRPGVSEYLVTNSELLAVGESIRIDKIYISTFRNRIATISFIMKEPNGDLLLKTFIEAYGTPSKPNRYIDSYLWRGKVVAAFVNVDKSTNQLGQSAAIFDLRMQDEIDAYGRKEAKKAIEGI